MNAQNKTIDEKILLAASRLPDSGFTAEELVVATFKEFPEDFCLMGFPEYPDSNKVLTQITTSRRGLQKKGWLVQIGKKRYQLTGEGRRGLTIKETASDEKGVRADDRDIADMLLHWIRSAAWSKFKAGKLASVSEREALTFWHLTSGASAAKTNLMLSVADSAIRFLNENREVGKNSEIHHVRTISPDEARQLINLNMQLRDRFKKELQFLRNQKH